MFVLETMWNSSGLKTPRGGRRKNVSTADNVEFIWFRHPEGAGERMFVLKAMGLGEGYRRNNLIVGCRWLSQLVKKAEEIKWTDIMSTF
jgi:hypothetical protein